VPPQRKQSVGEVDRYWWRWLRQRRTESLLERPFLAGAKGSNVIEQDVVVKKADLTVSDLDTADSSFQLLERESESMFLAAALSKVVQGRGQIILIEGHAGLGKSALMSSLTSLAVRSSVDVLQARGDYLEREFSFGIVLQLFEPRLARAKDWERDELLGGAAGLARHLLDRSSEPAEGPAEDRTFALLHGLYWLTTNLASERPVLIIVDDAHWADVHSLRFLSYLGQRLRDLPVIVAVAVRSGEPSVPYEALDELRRDSASTVLNLEPLSNQGVTRFIGSHLASAHPEFCEACAVASGGNPFLLGELLLAVAEEGLEPTSSAAQRVFKLNPDSVLRTTLERLRQLPRGSLEFARAVAVLGEAPIHHAAALAELDLNKAIVCADSLAGTAILCGRESLGFLHPLLRSAVYDAVPPASRAQMHSFAARLLSAEGASTEVVAGHLLSSARLGDAWVVKTFRTAAKRAIERGSPSSAITYLRRALAEPPLTEGKAQVLVELGEAEALAGEPKAIDHLEEALRLIDDDSTKARIRCRLGWMVHRSGRPGEAADLFDRALEDLGDKNHSLAQELTAGYLASALIVPARAKAAKERLESTDIDKAEEWSSVERSIATSIMAAHTIMCEWSAVRVQDTAKRIWGDGKLLQEEGPDTITLWQAIACLSWSDDLKLAESVCTAALDDARRRGSVIAAAHALYARSWPRYWMGLLSESIADAEAAVRAWRGPWGGDLPAACYWLSRGLAERSDLKGAAAVLEIQEDERWLGSGVFIFLLSGRGRIAFLNGNLDQALNLLTICLTVSRSMGVNPSVLAVRSDVALVASRLGRKEEARELVYEELDIARQYGAPRAIANALFAAARIEGRHRDIDLLEEALVTLEESPARLERARVLVELGASLRRHGFRKEARKPLREGAELARHCGALVIEREAIRELEVAGGRPHRLGMTGIDALSPSERRVAEMVVGGLTNREIAQALFVSVKAVEWHLSNTYRKLGVSSRKDVLKTFADQLTSTSP
jgi:DNA-binding CsgD family transcriptional regulator